MAQSPLIRSLRRTPPALFPSLMGLLGLGLAWRAMAQRLGIEAVSGLAEGFLGACVLLGLAMIGAWLFKFLARPMVLIDEVSILPGRAGVAAFAVSWMLLATVLVPYAPGVALAVAWAGIGALAVVALVIGVVLLRGPKEQRTVTPVFHLTFVGFIIAAVPLAQLGYQAVATEILFATMAIALVIWAFSLFQAFARVPPAPLRPLLAVHVSPASLFAIVASLLGQSALASGFAVMALAMALVLVVSGRWMLTAGFTPLWGALTFPLAACASASIHALGSPGLWIGAVLLMAASALNPYVAQRVVRMWVKGDLAVKTNAATA